VGGSFAGVSRVYALYISTYSLKRFCGRNTSLSSLRATHSTRLPLHRHFREQRSTRVPQESTRKATGNEMERANGTPLHPTCIFQHIPMQKKSVPLNPLREFAGSIRVSRWSTGLPLKDSGVETEVQSRSNGIPLAKTRASGIPLDFDFSSNRLPLEVPIFLWPSTGRIVAVEWTT
jgi:hypothetical protein